MKSYISIAITALLLSGCATTKVESEFSNLPITQNELQTAKWINLIRFPARYPEQAAIKSIQGCATVEYVVTPQNEIKDIKVVTTTNKYFGLSAKKVVQNWKWSDLPKNIIKQPVKTQTRFDFCLDKPNQSCTTISPEYSCPGQDIIYSTGSIIKRVTVRKLLN